MYPGSPIGSMPIMLPGVINTEKLFNTNYQKTLLQKSVCTYNQATSIALKLQNLAISDKLLIDACEFMNAIYEDMT